MTIFPGSGFGLDLDPEIPSESMHAKHIEQRGLIKKSGKSLPGRCMKNGIINPGMITAITDKKHKLLFYVFAHS